MQNSIKHNIYKTIDFLKALSNIGLFFKILLLIIFFIFNIAYLTGCIDVNIFIKINSDESGYINYSIAVDKEFYDTLGNNNLLEDIKNSLNRKYSSFKVLDKENQHFIIFKYNFSNFDDLTNLSNEIKKNGISLSVDKIEGILKTTYLLNAFLDTSDIDLGLFETDGSEIDNLSDLVDIEVKVSLPGKVIFLNEQPNSYDADQNTLLWKINFYEVSQIKAVSEVPKTEFFILISILFLIIISVIILSLFWYKSFRS